MKQGRPNTVAYVGGRLVLMTQHADCVELKTRSVYDGRDFEHSAVVYQTGDAWFVMINTNLKGNLEDIRTKTEGYASFGNALRGAFASIGTDLGWRR